MPDMISVILCDDHMVVRTGLAQLISSFPSISVIGQAENGEEALFLCQKHKPDIVIMDVKMDGMGGIAATRAIRDHHPDVFVMALSTFPNPEAVKDMMDAGAHAFLIKNILAHDLEQAIQKVYAGEVIISPDIDLAKSKTASQDSPDNETFNFGAQQKKVLALMTKGFTNPEIAEHLGISTPTARYHVSAILQKLDVSNRAEATAYAIRNGLIEEKDF